MELPLFYKEKMKQILKDEYEDYIKSFESEAQSGIRINTLKIKPEEFMKKGIFDLEPVKWCDEGFYCCDSQRPAKNYLYHAGLYYIQEPSAMSAASVLPVKENDKVLDLCAAPGGKTTQIAAKLNGTGILFSNDISAGRAKAIVKNIELFGVKNCVVLSESPEKLAERFEGYFDCILVDAPCSGEGMFRKKPDLIKTYNEEMIDFCEKTQRQILKSAAKMLKNGGYMVYSTCTFSPDEDERTVSDFLAENSDFSLVPINEKFGFENGRPEWSLRNEKEIKCCGRIWPHKQNGEGHFISLLTKNGGETEYINFEKSANEKEIAPVLDFIKENLNVKFNGIYKVINSDVYLLPENTPELKGLRVLRSGLLLGEVKKGRFEPSQALAMALKKENAKLTADFEKDDERIIRYLKGETVNFDGKDGWTLVCAEGYPLGWAKCQKGRLKNKYAAGWRWE